MTKTRSSCLFTIEGQQHYKPEHKLETHISGYELDDSMQICEVLSHALVGSRCNNVNVREKRVESRRQCVQLIFITPPCVVAENLTAGIELDRSRHGMACLPLLCM